ncbi:hypothetical protein [Nonomuraea gerenzanensis]|uniref:hypothetical protein n=1 Tax=Nonomuraea gerenzanensis TaxID=93944 RepID=UPI001CDA090E|nr:hypothetical protein [Nonomuraea gerenzanensis]UBU11610.1 hypothetical protein LCN96_46110 [Nonomuraea gerenzanensis]
MRITAALASGLLAVAALSVVTPAASATAYAPAQAHDYTCTVEKNQMTCTDASGGTFTADTTTDQAWYAFG